MKLPFAAIVISVLVLACDKRTPEEKGRDYAGEKLGFVEGVSKELQTRGKGIGEGVGKGVGDLVKGTGSAVKDVVHPSVNVTLSKALNDTGLGVGQATEGDDTASGREVVVHLRGDKAFEGSLELEGHGAAKLLVRSHAPQKVELAPGGTAVLRFTFDNSVRLSKLESFELLPVAERTISLSEPAKDSGIRLNQLSEKPTDQGYEVTAYAVFSKATNQGLSLRAFDSNHEEVSRSAPLPSTKRKADSAGFLTFTFDSRTSMTKVKSYELFLD